MNQVGPDHRLHVVLAANLPHLDLGWISLRDHFVATVGPRSGTGTPRGNLLVMADAVIQPNAQFPMHPHENMEVLTWVASGTLRHRDNQGADQTVPERSLQLMSSRDGIYHAEGNGGDDELRLVQIWIKPHTMGGSPVVATTRFEDAGFQLLVGPENAPLLIRQEAWLYAAVLHEEELTFMVPRGKSAYALSIGTLAWNDRSVADGSGIVVQEGTIRIRGKGQVLVILQN